MADFGGRAQGQARALAAAWGRDPAGTAVSSCEKRLSDTLTEQRGSAAFSLPVWQEHLIRCGDLLRDAGAYSQALELCYRRALLSFPTDLAATAAAAPTAWRPGSVCGRAAAACGDLVQRARALVGHAVCEYELVLGRDGRLLEGGSAGAVLACLAQLQQAGEAILHLDAQAGLLVASTWHICRAAARLLQGGYAGQALPFVLWCLACADASVALLSLAQLPWRVRVTLLAAALYEELGMEAEAVALARDCAEKLTRVEALEKASASPSEDAAAVFLSCRLELDTFLFRARALPARGAPTEPRAKTRAKSRAAKAQPAHLQAWPRTPAEGLLLRLFTSDAQRLVAVTRSLDWPVRRSAQPGAPRPQPAARRAADVADLFASGAALCLRELAALHTANGAIGPAADDETGVARLRAVADFAAVAFAQERSATFAAVLKAVFPPPLVELDGNGNGSATPDDSSPRSKHGDSAGANSKATPPPSVPPHLGFLNVLLLLDALREAHLSVPRIAKMKTLSYAADENKSLGAQPRLRPGFPHGLVPLASAILACVESRAHPACLDPVLDASLLVWARAKPFLQRFATLGDFQDAAHLFDEAGDGSESEPVVVLRALHQAFTALAYAEVDPQVAVAVAVKLALALRCIGQDREATPVLRACALQLEHCDQRLATARGLSCGEPAATTSDRRPALAVLHTDVVRELCRAELAADNSLGVSTTVSVSATGAKKRRLPRRQRTNAERRLTKGYGSNPLARAIVLVCVAERSPSVDEAQAILATVEALLGEAADSPEAPAAPDLAAALPPPIVLAVSTASVVLQCPAELAALPGIASFRVLGRAVRQGKAGEQGIPKARVMDTKLPGCELPRHVGAGLAPVAITSLEPHREYVFGVAAFDSAGHQIGRVSASTAPLLASAPLSATAIACFAAELAATRALASGTAATHTHAVGTPAEMAYGIGAALTQLDVERRELARELSADGAPLLDVQRQASALMQRLVGCLERALEIGAASLAVQAVLHLYRAVGPLVESGAVTAEVVASVVRCLHGLRQVAKLPSGQGPAVWRHHDVQQATAGLTLQAATRLCGLGEAAAAQLVAEQGLALLRAALLEPSGKTVAATAPAHQHPAGAPREIYLGLLRSLRGLGLAQEQFVHDTEGMENILVRQPAARAAAELRKHRKHPLHARYRARVLAKAFDEGNYAACIAMGHGQPQGTGSGGAHRPSATPVPSKGQGDGPAGAGHQGGLRVPSVRVATAVSPAPPASPEKKGTRSKSPFPAALKRTAKARRRVVLEYIRGHRADFAEEDARMEAQADAILRLQGSLFAYMERRRESLALGAGLRTTLLEDGPWHSLASLYVGLATAAQLLAAQGGGKQAGGVAPTIGAWADGGLAVLPDPENVGGAGGQAAPSEGAQAQITAAFRHLRRASVLAARAAAWGQTVNTAVAAWNTLVALEQALAVPAGAVAGDLYHIADALLDVPEPPPSLLHDLVGRAAGALLAAGQGARGVGLLGRLAKKARDAASATVLVCAAHRTGDRDALSCGLILLNDAGEDVGEVEELREARLSLLHLLLPPGVACAAVDAGGGIRGAPADTVDVASAITLYRRALRGTGGADARGLLECGCLCVASGDMRGAAAAWLGAIQAAVAAGGRGRGGAGGDAQAVLQSLPRHGLGPTALMMVATCAALLAEHTCQRDVDARNDWCRVAAAAAGLLMAGSLEYPANGRAMVDRIQEHYPSLAALVRESSPLPGRALFKGLEFCTTAVVLDGDPRAALAALCVQEHAARSLHDTEAVAATQLLKCRALALLGELGAALDLLAGLVVGRVCVPLVGGVARARRGGEGAGAPPAFDVGCGVVEASNAEAIAWLLGAVLSLSTKAACGAALCHRIELERCAFVLAATASLATPGIPRPAALKAPRKSAAGRSPQVKTPRLGSSAGAGEGRVEMQAEAKGALLAGVEQRLFSLLAGEEDNSAVLVLLAEAKTQAASFGAAARLCAVALHRAASALETASGARAGSARVERRALWRRASLLMASARLCAGAPAAAVERLCQQGVADARAVGDSRARAAWTLCSLDCASLQGAEDGAGLSKQAELVVHDERARVGSPGLWVDGVLRLARLLGGAEAVAVLSDAVAVLEERRRGDGERVNLFCPEIRWLAELKATLAAALGGGDEEARRACGLAAEALALCSATQGGLPKLEAQAALELARRLRTTPAAALDAARLSAVVEATGEGGASSVCGLHAAVVDRGLRLLQHECFDLRALQALCHEAVLMRANNGGGEGGGEADVGSLEGLLLTAQRAGAVAELVEQSEGLEVRGKAGSSLAGRVPVQFRRDGDPQRLTDASLAAFAAAAATGGGGALTDEALADEAGEGGVEELVRQLSVLQGRARAMPADRGLAALVHRLHSFLLQSSPAYRSQRAVEVGGGSGPSGVHEARAVFQWAARRQGEEGDAELLFAIRVPGAKQAAVGSRRVPWEEAMACHAAAQDARLAAGGGSWNPAAGSTSAALLRTCAEGMASAYGGGVGVGVGGGVGVGVDVDGLGAEGDLEAVERLTNPRTGGATASPAVSALLARVLGV